MKTLNDSDVEEGSPCNQKGCEGKFIEAEVVNCSCHINPPCSACVNAGYVCDVCGYATSDFQKEREQDRRIENRVFPKRDRTDETTRTHVSDPYNSTPFTNCCGVAAVNESRCPVCKARIVGHDDGLAERRRWAKGGCLMCGKPQPKKHLGEPGTCCC